MIQECAAHLTTASRRLILNHMVEYNAYLDGLFGSLADPVRRDILQRLMYGQHTISQLARHYDMSFAAVAKHLNVLERSKLVNKRRQGKEMIVSIAPDALRDAADYLTRFESLWQYRLDALENLLREEDQDESSESDGRTGPTDPQNRTDV